MLGWVGFVRAACQLSQRIVLVCVARFLFQSAEIIEDKSSFPGLRATSIRINGEKFFPNHGTSAVVGHFNPLGTVRIIDVAVRIRNAAGAVSHFLQSAITMILQRGLPVSDQDVLLRDAHIGHLPGRCAPRGYWLGRYEPIVLTGNKADGQHQPKHSGNFFC